MTNPLTPEGRHPVFASASGYHVDPANNKLIIITNFSYNCRACSLRNERQIKYLIIMVNNNRCHLWIGHPHKSLLSFRT